MLDASNWHWQRAGSVIAFIANVWVSAWIAPITMTVVPLASWLSVITLGIEATEASKSAAMSVSQSVSLPSASRAGEM